MHRKKTFRLPFTKKDINSGSLPQILPSETVSKSCKYYQHINELPLFRFKDVSVNRNLSALIISGFPSQINLLNAWEKINIQFSDAMGNNDHKVYVQLAKQIAVLEATWWQINEIAKLLNLCCELKVFPADIYAELNKLTQSNFSFKKDDHESNLSNIQRCVRRGKSIFIRIQMLNGQMEEHHKKQVTGKVTEEWFTQMLITLSDFAKYPVQDTITTFEFCERIKRFNQYHEQVKVKAGGK